MGTSGQVLACIPNAQHWSVQARLASGIFRYEDQGLLDRTHLRWFTRITIIELFQSAGFRILEMFPRIFDEPMKDRFLPGIISLATAAGGDREVALRDSLPLPYVLRAVPISWKWAQDPSMIEVVSATRLSESDFWNKSALGSSLRRLAHDARLVPHLAFANRRGLPDIFNARISAPDGHELLVFVHDDVWIDDYFLADRVIEGLQTYDVIGVAGNRRRIQNQPAWIFVDNQCTWDSATNLSGRVAHGRDPCGQVSFYGAVPAECELLDGVFLGARKSALTANGVLFDPR